MLDQEQYRHGVFVAHVEHRRDCRFVAQEKWHLSYRKPTAIGNMNRDKLDAELSRGYESAISGKTYSADEVDKIMKDEFNV